MRRPLGPPPRRSRRSPLVYAWEPVSPANLRDWRAENTVLEAIAAWQRGSANIAAEGESDAGAERVGEALVEAGSFHIPRA